MPTYQYACTSCDHGFEVVQSFSDAPLTDCPQCSGRLRKVFSAVGVVFKGSGFYRTDSRTSPPAAKPKPEAAPGDNATSTAKENASPASTTNTSGPEKKSNAAPKSGDSAA